LVAPQGHDRRCLEQFAGADRGGGDKATALARIGGDVDGGMAGEVEGHLVATLGAELVATPTLPSPQGGGRRCGEAVQHVSLPLVGRVAAAGGGSATDTASVPSIKSIPRIEPEPDLAQAILRHAGFPGRVGIAVGAAFEIG